MPLSKVRYLCSTNGKQMFTLFIVSFFAFHCLFVFYLKTGSTTLRIQMPSAIINEDLLQYSQHREFYYQISRDGKKNLFIGVSPVPFSNVSAHTPFHLLLLLAVSSPVF